MSILELFHVNSRWALLLLLLIPIVWGCARLRNRPTAIRFSSTTTLHGLGRSWRVRLWWLLPTLRTLVLLLLVIALARPQKGNEQTRIPAQGIAIQLLVDRSGSMQAMDFVIDNQRVDRLRALESVVQEFINGDGELAGRPDDLIGMITFARYADDRCPLTLDHDYVVETLAKTKIATTREEDGTAIGEAIGLGVERLRALDEQQRRRGGERVKSKVMILLTDGENNAGELDPLTAAELAETLGIKVYTIGVGTRGFAPVPVRNPLTGREVLQQMRVNIDEETLTQIAEATGGQYFRATDTDSLRAIYKEIDELEKTRTVELRYYQYTELATHSVRLGPLRVPPLLLIVFVLLTLEVLFRHTLLRRLP